MDEGTSAAADAPHGLRGAWRTIMLVVMGVLGVGVLVALILTSRYLARRTRRRFNIGVAAAILAIVFGLSTDYEIFLLSRMVEARQKGATTTEAVRVGTAHTGRIITAAAAILIVVTGAFGLSEIVMMKIGRAHV